MVQSQISAKTGVSSDWYNELFPLHVNYTRGGINAAIQYLCVHPLRTYEKRKNELLVRGKDDPAYCDFVKKEYAITEENADNVRRIDAHVRMFNSAASSGRLTAKMHERFYGHLTVLLYGKPADSETKSV